MDDEPIEDEGLEQEPFDDSLNVEPSSQIDDVVRDLEVESGMEEESGDRGSEERSGESAVEFPAEATMTPEQYADDQWTLSRIDTFQYNPATGEMLSEDGKSITEQIRSGEIPVTGEQAARHEGSMQMFRENPSGVQLEHFEEPVENGIRINHTLLWLEGDEIRTQTWSREILNDPVEDDDNDGHDQIPSHDLQTDVEYGGQLEDDDDDSESGTTENNFWLGFDLAVRADPAPLERTVGFNIQEHPTVTTLVHRKTESIVVPSYEAHEEFSFGISIESNVSLEDEVEPAEIVVELMDHDDEEYPEAGRRPDAATEVMIHEKPLRHTLITVSESVTESAPVQESPFSVEVSEAGIVIFNENDNEYIPSTIVGNDRFVETPAYPESSIDAVGDSPDAIVQPFVPLEPIRAPMIEDRDAREVATVHQESRMTDVIEQGIEIVPEERREESADGVDRVSSVESSRELILADNGEAIVEMDNENVETTTEIRLPEKRGELIQHPEATREVIEEIDDVVIEAIENNESVADERDDDREGAEPLVTAVNEYNSEESIRTIVEQKINPPVDEPQSDIASGLVQKFEQRLKSNPIDRHQEVLATTEAPQIQQKVSPTVPVIPIRIRSDRTTVRNQPPMIESVALRSSGNRSGIDIDEEESNFSVSRQQREFERAA